MFRGIYSAATAMDLAAQQQEVTAANLAGMSVPGYRQRSLAVQSFDRVLGKGGANSLGEIYGSQITRVWHDFQPGPLQQTGNPLDWALSEADTFFELAGPEGPIYSRNGSFRLNRQGEIISSEGYPVQGTGGALSIPENSREISVGQDGSVMVDGQPLGQVRIVRFADPSSLQAVGPSLYRADPQSTPEVAAGGLMQGYREGSNVKPAETLTRMILGARFFEAAQRALRTIAETTQINTRP